MDKGKNAQERVLELYLFFKKGVQVSTKELALQYNTSNRTITRDINTINSIITPSRIEVDRITNLWSLDDRLLDDEEAFILNILDKACVEQGEAFHNKALNLFEKFKNSLHNTIYNNIDSEDISDIKEELIKVEKAIFNKKRVSLIYTNKTRTVEPLKLANFDGYWYLIVYEIESKKIKAFYFKDISAIKILQQTFTFDDYHIKKVLHNAINTYFKTDVKPYEIELFVSKEIAKIFKRKPISKSQRVVEENSDGSFALSIDITNDMEIIPKIQQFMPYIKIVNNDKNSQRVIDTISKNIENFSASYD